MNPWQFQILTTSKASTIIQLVVRAEWADIHDSARGCFIHYPSYVLPKSEWCNTMDYLAYRQFFRLEQTRVFAVFLGSLKMF